MLAALVSALVAAAPVHTLEQDFPKAKLSMRPGQSSVSMVIGLDAALPGGADGALLFFHRYGGAFGLGPEDALVLRSRRGDANATYLRFDRVKAGVPVLDAEIVATFDAAGRLTMVHAGPQVPPARGAFTLPSPRRGAVQRWLRTTERRGEEIVDVLRPAWVTNERREAGTAWRATDAETGAELGKRLIRWSASGAVFDFSPVRDGAQLCPQQPDAGYDECAQTVMRPFGNLTSLQNARVVARNCQGGGQSTSCVPRATPNGSGDFVEPTTNQNSNMDRFGELMAWYHADRFSAWLDATSPPFLAGGGLGTVDVFTNVGNYEGAFFDEGGTFGRFAVRLGQGAAADWAYDADILCHELGHGTVARTSNFTFYVRDGLGIEGDPGSLNEGTADCLALSLKGSPQLGENAGTRLIESAASNAPTNPYLRTAANKRMCQITSVDGTTLATGGRAGEIHADGVIWGSFFWSLRSRLASVPTSAMCPNCNAADIILLRALEALGSGASFNDATLALQQVAASQFGTNEAQLVGCMSCEWNMPSCDGRLREVYPGETHEALLVDSSAGSYGGQTPATFQYAIDVPASTTVLFNRFAIDSGALTLLARFGSPIQWSGSSSNATHMITAQGQSLPSQTSAGRWYVQGVHNGADIRRFGFRVNFVPSGNNTTRPAPNGVTCALGGGIPMGCACTPQCAGKQCGSDGCGGSCGTCMSGQTCSATSQCNCQPQCAGRQCGTDGCGGVCGMCQGGQMCTPQGTCSCTPNCAGRTCGNDGCGGSCGSCAGTEFCNTAGTCQTGANPCQGRDCGPDGQGGSCGSCAQGQACNATGQCVVQAGPCAGLQCGPDGQGGSCGECPAGRECAATGLCVEFIDGCVTRLCGPDGFGGSCGTCGEAEECTANGTCVKSMGVNGGCGCGTGPLAGVAMLGAWLLRRRREER